MLLRFITLLIALAFANCAFRCRNPFNCPNGNVVFCFANPCDVTTCPLFPNAQCCENYCGGCNADFFVNGKIVKCSCPIVKCPPGVQRVACLVDPCRFATCPAVPDAVCCSNYCGGCNAVFYRDGRPLPTDQCGFKK